MNPHLALRLRRVAGLLAIASRLQKVAAEDLYLFETEHHNLLNKLNEGFSAYVSLFERLEALGKKQGNSELAQQGRFRKERAQKFYEKTLNVFDDDMYSALRGMK